MSHCFQIDLESYPKHYGYDDDNDVDYDREAQEMFQKFMSNTKIETSAMSDLGMDKVTTKFKDPRPKMEQRHQIVSYLSSRIEFDVFCPAALSFRIMRMTSPETHTRFWDF